jgi:trehalose/maltose hydrolase-like predicted phosphorylase
VSDVPLSPPKEIGSGRKELPAYVSNGVIGLRIRPNPLDAGMALVSGYTGLHPVRQIEAAATVPYPLGLDICLNGVWASDHPQGPTVREQEYDFANGELTSRLRFAVGEANIEIEILTLCCRHQPTLVLQETRIVANTACDVGLRAMLDVAQVPGRLIHVTRHTPGEEKDAYDGSLVWRSEGGLSECGVALVTEMLGAPDVKDTRDPTGIASPLLKQYTFRARAGRAYRLRQMVSIVPSAIHDQPDRQAERLVAYGAHAGFDAARAANRAEWDELWKGRIRLVGAERRWQAMADAAFFYLNTSVHTGSPASTSMFGLATWHDYHYYYGHVMWDIETFAVPPLIFTQPEAALSLLEYRFRNRDGARRNAQAFGRRGLQFPWESAAGSGLEAAPSPGTAAWHEDHVSLDVALAFAQYAHVSGDKNFLIDRAWPILSGVADWIVSRTHRGRTGYEIRRSMGIAEKKQEVDNDAYTMLAARQVLDAAIQTAAAIGRSEGTQWRAVRDGLVLPERHGVLVTHKGYRSNEEKGATPSPVMGVFPLPDTLDEAMRRATLDVYLDMWKEYVGSPMLSAFYGVWAARRGKPALALKLLDEGYAQFVSGRFLQTLEYRPDKFPEQPQAGPFFANMGGFLMSLILGFPNIQPNAGDPGTWTQGPVSLPQGWKRIEVNCLWIHGRRASLRAVQGAAAVIAL